jgi:uncharacterized repeat protein (TIGR02059 family)
MKKSFVGILTLILVIFFTGCNKNLDNGPGRLVIKITDDPLDISSVESATVTISKIEIRQAGAEEGDPFMELPMSPVTVNIFELRNGITEELVNLEVPQGDYDLVRLYVDEANLKLKEIDDPFNLKVPSGEQTGIKVFVDPVIHVAGGISSELLLDFDLSNSFVMRGHNARNGFIFKPRIRASNISTAGRIEGVVKDDSEEGLALEGVTMTLLQDGVETATAQTDVDGYYAFIGVTAGNYSVSAEKEGYVPADDEEVVVIPGNKVIKDFTLVGLPVYVGSVIENATPAVIEMTFSLSLANIVPDVSAFAVTVAGSVRAVSSLTVSDKKVMLTLASAVSKGEAVTVAYTKPATNPLQTPDGLETPSFTAQEVTNNVN